MESSTDEIPIVMDVQPEGEAAMEPIAVIGPEEAAEVSGQRWASGIELLVSGAASTAVDASSIDIVVLQFSRDQRAFDEVLLSSPIAERALASGIDLQPHWANGGKICPTYGYYCTLPWSHSGDHSTRHGNMRKTYFVSGGQTALQAA